MMMMMTQNRYEQISAVQWVMVPQLHTVCCIDRFCRTLTNIVMRHIAVQCSAVHTASHCTVVQSGIVRGSAEWCGAVRCGVTDCHGAPFGGLYALWCTMDHYGALVHQVAERRAALQCGAKRIETVWHGSLWIGLDRFGVVRCDASW